MLTPSQLNDQYNARAAIPDHPQIFARWRAASRIVRDGLRYEADCFFGPSPAELLDLYPTAKRNAPLITAVGAEESAEALGDPAQTLFHATLRLLGKPA